MPLPDFTKGDPIPAEAKMDWNLGATGARGWMYSDRMVTSDARQVRITAVAPKSPADGKLVAGDVILGVGGQQFSYDPRTEIGKALTVAEAKDGKLILSCWREGKTMDITLDLPVMGSYSATAPYSCEKSKRILEQGCEALAKSMEQANYRADPIVRSLNGLALLASGESNYLPLLKKEAAWAKDYTATSMATWYYGYVSMFLSEYIMATGDDSVLPGLRRIVMEAAKGQSIVGSWGHKFAGPDGRLVGYGMMNSPGVPLTIGMTLARQAGVKDPEVQRAVERSMRLLRFYIGKGAIPYGDHAPWMENHEDNGKCGMATVLFDLLKEEKGAEFFSRMSLSSHGAERDTGHTGNYFNILWAMPAVARSGPQASGAWMKEFGSWYYDLARRFDGKFEHLGPPSFTGDSYKSWDATGAILLAYAQPLKKIYLTGKKPSDVPPLDAAAAQKVVIEGRGWDNKHRDAAYDAISVDGLIEMLGSWSPIIRDRASLSLARRRDVDPTPTLIKMLNSSSLNERYGACNTLKYLKSKSVSAVPALRATFKADDLWLRIQAADALAAMGPAAMETLPELLQRICVGPTAQDPRGMEQRFLCFAVFGSMLKNSLNGVDPKQLRAAIIAGLKNEDGRARQTVSMVYPNLSLEALKTLMPEIQQAIVVPAPSGIMFADGCQTAGLQLLARYRFREAMEMIVAYGRTQKMHASQQRIVPIMAMLKQYGAHAKTVIPQLEALAKYFDAGEVDFPKSMSLEKAKVVRDTIETIKASTDMPELKSLKD